MSEPIKILFTKSDKIFSKLIRKVTKGQTSHCAILWQQFVLHSSFGGVEIINYSDFLAKNKVIYYINTDTKIDKLLRLLFTYHGRMYDILGFLYLGLRLVFPKLLPKKNLWQTTGMFMCTELVSKLVIGKEDSLLTPDELYIKLKQLNSEDN